MRNRLAPPEGRSPRPRGLRYTLALATFCVIALVAGCEGSPDSSRAVEKRADSSGVVCGIATTTGHAIVCARAGRALSIEFERLTARGAAWRSALPLALTGRWRSATGTHWYLQTWADGRYVVEVEQIS